MKHFYSIKSIVFVIGLMVCFIAQAQVGVGTETPAYTFQVVNDGDIGATSLAESTNSGDDGVALSGFNVSSANGFNAFEGVTEGLFSGVYGLSSPTAGTGYGVYGVANSSDAIGVFGSVPTTGSWLGYGGLFIGGLGYANGIYNLSDARAKRDISEIDNALLKIKGLKAYTYKYDSYSYNSKRANDNQIHYGFMAQNVKEHLPHAVAEKSVKFPADSQSPKSNINEAMVSKTLNVVDYTAIIPVLVQAMKEQQYIIDTQKAELKSLSEKLSRIESKLNDILKN
ncbi:tail fiber domain-containing protein [Winogradskyella sp. DF17]|uniref:Tail fiber domain-containing protein n=1 Tax=Winogradskyella pelagia TaxID=2819984 RepID=A0ABS3T0T3_9FLAO|nr:tail fiber domain-containing protein [Winogradskyella sp. DF17]MBO3116348.1 tail fiber domain-containing protein [Winogradskyella sp. DF17]